MDISECIGLRVIIDSTMEIEKQGSRKVPNILVTGTPGTGKTSFCQLLNQSLSFTYLPIAKIINEHQLFQGWNTEFEVYEFDEDKLLDHVNANYKVAEGGLLFDFQNPQVFPQDYFDVIILLRCENETLYKRLEQRGYKPEKIRQNIECQIFEEIKYNIEEHFHGMVPVLELRNEKKEEMEGNLQTVINFLVEYKKKREVEASQ